MGPGFDLPTKIPQDFESCHKIRSSLVAQELNNWRWRSLWDLEGFIKDHWTFEWKGE